MKALLVTHDFPPVPGGMARYYAALAAGFDDERFLVSTTAGGEAGDPPPPRVRVQREPFPMCRSHRFGARLRWRRDLGSLLERERSDALLCGNLRPAGPFCLDLARRHGLSFVFFVHGNDLLAARRRWSGWRRSTWDRVVSGAAAWIANSAAVRTLGIESCGLDAERGHVVPPEVDPARFRPAAPGEVERLRAAFGLPLHEPVVLYVGRLVKRKGLDRLIAASARLARPGAGGPRFSLMVAGPGDAAPYREQAARAGLAERVIFAGAPSFEELPGYYRAADLLAMPSRTLDSGADVEGFGIVYLEAAACGLPSLAGRSGGAPEAVLDGATGLVVDGEHEAQVESALARLLGDAGLRRRLGEVARRRALADFGPGSMAGKVERILAGLAPTGPGRR